MAIVSFKCADTKAIFEGGKCKRWASERNVIERKLAMLDAAVKLSDLRSPPGNRLEALVGNRAGQHSIRVNDQWRVCFVWGINGPENVEVVDYH